MRSMQPLILLMLFALLSLGVALGNPLAGVDQTLAEWLRLRREPFGDGVFILITSLADAANLAPIIGILSLGLAAAGDRRGGLIWMGGTLCILLLNPALKNLFAVPRPEYLLQPLSSYSYPSGHTSDAALIYLLSAWFLTRYRPQKQLSAITIALGMTLLTALSRLYLGVHWLSDVLGGLLLGSGLALLLINAMRANPSSPQVRQPTLSLWLAGAWSILYLTWRLPQAWQSYTALPL